MVPRSLPVEKPNLLPPSLWEPFATRSEWKACSTKSRSDSCWTTTSRRTPLVNVVRFVARVEAMTEEIKVGRVYNGTVSSVKDFGAFIEIAPGKDGLCHISELSTGYVKSVDEICKVGDKLQVKVIAIDEQNRVKLSRKAVLAEQAEGQTEGAAKTESGGGDEDSDD